MHIALTGFQYLYCIGVFNTCQLNVAATLQWGSSTSYFINLFSTLLVTGQTIGCIITGKLIDNYGRRKSMIMTDILFILASIVLVMPSTVCFGIGRFFVGVSTGIGATLGPIYLGESTPMEMMPKVGPIIYVFSGIGMITAYALGLTLPVDNIDTDPKSYLWIFMFLFPALIAAYQLFYFCYWVKYDTPQFYLSRNRSQDAETALRLTYNEEALVQGLRRANSEIEGKSWNGTKLSFFEMIRSKRFRKMMRVGIIFAGMQQLAGTTAIFFYSTDIFLKFGGGLFLARLLTLIIGIVNLLSMVSSVWLLPLIGRKKIYVASQIMVSILLSIMALFSGYIQADPIVAAVFLIIYFIPCGCGIICTGWMYATEILNDQVFSFISSLNFAFGILVSLLFPFSVEYIGLNNTFLFFSGCMALCSVYSMLDLIETKDKDKETILIGMGVIEMRVLPGAEDNNSLQSPCECEEEKSGFEGILKGNRLNSTGFNDVPLPIND